MDTPNPANAPFAFIRVHWRFSFLATVCDVLYRSRMFGIHGTDPLPYSIPP